MRDFRFSVSTTKYDRNKDENKTGWLKWEEKTGTIEDIQRYIMNNYAICHCYHHTTPTFTNEQKTELNFQCTNMIMLDLDAVKYNAVDFWKLMQETEITPNLVYTTKNNGLLKKPDDKYPNRYRAVYVLDNAIDNAALYKKLVSSIKSEIAMYCDDNSVFNDNTDINCSHFFAGNDEAMCFVQHNAFTLQFFIQRYDLELSSLSYIIKERRGKVIKYDKLDSNSEMKFSDEAFAKQWQCKSDIRLLYDFNMYSTYTTTQIDWNEGELFRYVEDKYVYNLERRWRKIADPLRHAEYHTIVRYRYGEHRKKKIWSALLIRRLIDPTMTLEQLCYAAVYELYNFIDNTDDEHFITRKHLKHIAEEILNLDLDIYKDRYRWRTKSGNNKTYITNKMERIKQGLTNEEVMVMANRKFGIYERNSKTKADRKQIEYEQLSKKYDPNKSVRENAALLGVSNGTIQSLKKWIKERDNKEEKPMTREEQERDMYNMVKELYDYYMPKPIKAPENNFLDFLKNSKKNLAVSKP